MRIVDGNMGADGARALIISERAFSRSLASAAWDECEDLLVELGGAQLYGLDAKYQRGSHRARRAIGRSLRRATGSSQLLPPGGLATPAPADHDVVVAVLYSVWSTVTLEAIPGLRKAAGGVVGWFPEVWPSQLHPNLAFEPFGLFDEIFVGEPRSAELLTRMLKRPVHVLPPATDVEVFSDRGRTVTGPHRQRPIDVVNIGRRDAALHDRLLSWAQETDAFYVYDTTRRAAVVDAAAHRSALARQLQRTKVKVASFAKHDEPKVVGDLRWIPSRVFDGLASGTLLAGHAPDPASQLELFGREVVYDLPQDDPHLSATVIARLTREDDEAERRANVSAVMAGHDWSHRWVALFETCGLTPPSQLVARAERLTVQGRTGLDWYRADDPEVPAARAAP